MPDGAVASSEATRQLAWPQWGERQFDPDAPRRPPPRMGYQPGLDGLRAVWLFVVMAYHAGFSWMHGGYVSLEVFFVLSGFLITTLLLEERTRAATSSSASSGCVAPAGCCRHSS